MAVLISSFKQSLKSAPYVLKTTHFYFGFYFIAFVICVFAVLPYFVSPEQDFSSTLSIYSGIINFVTSASLTFIVSYYTYKHAKGPDIRPFWNFIRKTFWPVIWNFYIKATIIILFFFILLIIPGIYKGTRLSFIPDNHLF